MLAHPARSPSSCSLAVGQLSDAALTHSSCCACRLRAGHLAMHGPDEGRQLAGDRGCDHRRCLAFPRQRTEPCTEPNLGLPGDLACPTPRTRDLGLLLVSAPRRMAVGPGGFDQHTPRPAVAGLGDRSALDALA